MTTTVTNRHHPNVSFDVYIGRGSDWGNPYSHLNDTKAEYKVETREQAIAAYTDYIFKQRHLLARIRKELGNKTLGCFCAPAACHGDVLARIADTSWWKDDRIILECSTKGDILYSAFGAEINLFGVKGKIEHHYQLAKRFIDHESRLFVPKSIYDVKGKNSKTKDMFFLCIEVNGVTFPPEFRVEFYKLMWLMYLDQHSELVEWASRFDDYNDIFKGSSAICQADCIRQYIKQGRDTMVDDVIGFAELIGIDAGTVILGAWGGNEFGIFN